MIAATSRSRLLTATPHRFLALGDSFSAGIDAGEVPWPQEVAQALRTRRPDLEFDNLATVGATSQVVIDDQLDLALEREPDLVTLICGANDVLLSVKPDTAAFAARLDKLLEALRAMNSDPLVVTATYPDIASFLPLRARTAQRVSSGLDEVNATVRELSALHGAHCLEWAGHAGVSEPENFAHDDFHPSPIGHRRAAAAFAEGLAGVLEVPIENEPQP